MYTHTYIRVYTYIYIYICICRYIEREIHTYIFEGPAPVRGVYNRLAVHIDARPANKLMKV